jgi:hypothetical protein
MQSIREHDADALDAMDTDNGGQHLQQHLQQQQQQQQQPKQSMMAKSSTTAAAGSDHAMLGENFADNAAVDSSVNDK